MWWSLNEASVGLTSLPLKAISTKSIEISRRNKQSHLQVFHIKSVNVLQ